MPFKDLREFIAKLEKEGQARRIEEEVDWNLEAGAMLRISGEKDWPAPFFQHVKGYPKGYRLFGGTLSNYKRVAIAMDMDINTTPKDLMAEYIRRKQHPIRPLVVGDGPCKENIHLGDDVDLLEFPIPLIHEGDGGRYVGSWHVTIAKEQNGGWVNWGMYRHQLQNKNTIGILNTSARKHFSTIYSREYPGQGGSMEVAIAIGVEPISTLCAGTPLETRVSEADIAGSLRGEPVQVVRCETVDLMVPATSEIVIEGEFRPDEKMMEGPFGEYTGYSSSPPSPKPIIRVKAVTHRNDPILTMSCPGIPLEDNLVWYFAKSAAFLEALLNRGLPVTAVNAAPESASLLTVVSVREPYPGIAADIAHLLWGIDSAHASPYIVVVEDDVDPFNINQVIHTICTRCHPVRGIVTANSVPVTPLLPFLSPHERQYKLGAMACFDCIWPPDWNKNDIPKRISFADAYPDEIQNKALEKWGKQGL